MPHLKSNNIARSNMSIHSEEASPFVFEMKNKSVEVLPEPFRSPLDEKQYKTIKLQNGLIALLISNQMVIPDDGDQMQFLDENTMNGSDPHSDKSENGSDDNNIVEREEIAACALSVGVGSFSDPADVQGLAHFVEHMLFMGSYKYPKENHFDLLTSKHGGSNNAATDTETTTYIFEIQEKHLAEALDVFSQLFISPLIKLEAMQREMNAVESEFALRMPSYVPRLNQLLYSLFPAGHPQRYFRSGNLNTLKETVPGDSYLHRKAHAFKDRHYSAHRMTLAIQAGFDLKTLEQLVIKTFGLVPNNHLPPANFTEYTYNPRIVTPEFHSLYYMKPLGDSVKLHLNWCMKEIISLYQSKPDEYVSYLMEHEGPGSLLSYLKNKVWALSIVTDTETSSIQSIFSIKIDLTQEGYNHLDQVLTAVFSYIRMMQTVGPSRELFEEIQTIASNEYRYKQEILPLDNVEALAENMHLYPPEHYLDGGSLYFKYDAEEINYILNSLSPETVNIIVSSRENMHGGKKVEYDTTEQWFGTEYKRMKIPSEWKQTWRQIKPYKEFHQPIKNIYISTNFDLIPLPANKKINGHRVSVINADSKAEKKTFICKSTNNAFRMKSSQNISPYDPVVYGKDVTDYDEPYLLRKDDKMELWYKPDYKFRLPKAFIYFSFLTLLTMKTAKDNCLLSLWAKMLTHDLSEQLYAADLAGLSHDVYVTETGLTLQADGYNEKLHLLVDVITKRMREYSSAITPDMFTAIRESEIQFYHNQGMKPEILAEELGLSIIQEPSYTSLERARVLESVTFSDLQTFGDRFLDSLYAQVLVQGNLGENEARAVADLVQQNIAWKALPQGDLSKVVARQLPKSVQNCRVSSLNHYDSNSYVGNYYQTNMFSWKEEAIIILLVTLMEEPAFNTLRTKEQLGYSVFCQEMHISGVLGYSVIVATQADKYSASYVDKRIEAFFESFAQDVHKLTERELSETKEALIKQKQTDPVDLEEEVSSNWDEIIGMEYTFDRKQRQAAAIANLTLADVQEWFEQHSVGGGNYRKLSVQVIGHPKKSNNESAAMQPETDGQTSSAYNLRFLSDNVHDNSSENFVLDVQTYRETLPLYPDITVKLENC